MTPGPQFVTRYGAGISSDPRAPACPPVGEPREGTVVDTQATLSQEGSDWVARAVNGAGNFELRFHATAQDL
jgi:hypothetical protein